MTKMFSKLKTDDLEESQDRVGGGGFTVPTNVYDAIIKVAYVTTAASGAQAVNLIVEAGGAEVRFAEYVTDREGKNYFHDKNDKTKKIPLPSFTNINDLCLLITGEELSEQEFGTKVLKVYNPTERKEVNQECPVIEGLTDQPIMLAIQRIKSWKQKKGEDGKYHDTAETRMENSLVKVMHPETGRTVNEYRHEVESPEFRDAWLKANEGKDWDKTAGKGSDSSAGAAGTGRPGGGGEDAPKKKSLFSKKS